MSTLPNSRLDKVENITPVSAKKTNEDKKSSELAGVFNNPITYALPKDTVHLQSLKEGDFLLVLNADLVSISIATCGTSYGVSHCGSLIRMGDGLLYVAESKPNWIDNSTSGVQASRITDFMSGFKIVVAYRPDNITSSQLIDMRKSFLSKIGKPYSLNIFELVNSFAGQSIFKINDNGYFCSRLTATLYKDAGLLHAHNVCCGIPFFSDGRYKTCSYRPYDLPYVINSKRLGRIISK